MPGYTGWLINVRLLWLFSSLKHHDRFAWYMPCIRSLSFHRYKSISQLCFLWILHNLSFISICVLCVRSFGALCIWNMVTVVKISKLNKEMNFTYFLDNRKQIDLRDLKMWAMKSDPTFCGPPCIVRSLIYTKWWLTA